MKRINLENASKIRKEMQEADVIWEGIHLCYSCEHCLRISTEFGNLVSMTQDYNDCPYAADILYNDGDKYGIKKSSGLFDNSTDNGMGYWITRCPFYFKIRNLRDGRYNSLMWSVENHTKALISMGVSPDTAADNAGYIMYALLGGKHVRPLTKLDTPIPITENQIENGEAKRSLND